MNYLIPLILGVCVLCSCQNEHAHDTKTSPVSGMTVVNETDPICNMRVKEHLSDTAMIDGQVWGFCSIVCKEKYLQSEKAK
jgi:YHS domain-containing protein